MVSIGIHAGELVSFAEMANAVATGKQLTFVWNLKNCSSENSLPEIITSVKPNAVMVIANQRITASDRHFSLNDPSLPNKPSFTFSKYNLKADGQASLDITVMRAED